MGGGGIGGMGGIGGFGVTMRGMSFASLMGGMGAPLGGMPSGVPHHTPSVEDPANTFRGTHDDAACDNEEEEEKSSSDEEDESEEEEDEDEDEA